ncbi:unnamed protein product [Protopolystoma xenopodis]|uniref:Uncharacterized protein n=1 Tax=Protopolystoma xenopodis TaxID=117903 RepID=A0A3S4ZQA2_9PLAT|nr:unnamed protein product [Protopolystoma xenopodis]
MPAKIAARLAWEQSGQALFTWAFRYTIGPHTRRQRGMEGGTQGQRLVAAKAGYKYEWDTLTCLASCLVLRGHSRLGRTIRLSTGRALLVAGREFTGLQVNCLLHVPFCPVVRDSRIFVSHGAYYLVIFGLN